MELTHSFRESKTVNLMRGKGAYVGQRKEHMCYLCPSASMKHPFYQQAIKKNSRIAAVGYAKSL